MRADRFAILFGYLLTYHYSIAQHVTKPVIDSNAIKSWSLVSDGKMSRDGKYVSYSETSVAKQQLQLYDVVIQMTDGSWKMKFPDQRNNFSFSDDSKTAFLLSSGDSLVLLQLSTGKIQYLTGIKNYRLIENKDKHFLGYYAEQSGTTLQLLNLVSGKKIAVNVSGNYRFDDSLTTLLWFTTDTLHRLNIEKDEQQLTYPDEQTKQVLRPYRIVDLQKITDDGKDLFVRLKKRESEQKRPATGVALDLWSYTDTRLQSQQLAEKSAAPSYLAVIHLADYSIKILQHDSEQIKENNGKWLVVLKSAEPDEGFGSRESYWNRACDRKYFLRSVKDDSEIYLSASSLVDFKFSPDGRFVVLFDEETAKCESYEIGTGIRRDISKRIPVSLRRPDFDYPDHVTLTSTGKYQPPLGLVKNGWVLMSDWYDIWQVDLQNKYPPLNITHGYGRQHNIYFTPAYGFRKNVFDSGSTIILKAFDRITKENGFFSAMLNHSGSLEKLTMEPYRYDFSSMDENGGTYLVKRASEKESPNYFLTGDFKVFKQISDIHPEKNYNWMTAELVNWKMPDGKYNQGILYKPEDFDSTKKYPLIFYYYEQLSDEMHEYKQPDLVHGDLNISWIVNRGYLVFTPDIHYKVGHAGESACNTVVSAAQYLSKRKYIDAKHMGIQGHSFGGFETNYIVTHTPVFAAACSASGLSDYTEEFNGLWEWGASKQEICQFSQGRMGTTPWERPDLYLRNSPIYYVDKVTTPVLLMHNKSDGSVEFSQGRQFFTALRRLGKKAWLLQYDNGVHIIDDWAGALDFTIRMTQFFDHYLKGAPAPRWMLDGIPAYLKGIESRLELDSTGRTPGPGLLKPLLMTGDKK